MPYAHCKHCEDLDTEDMALRDHDEPCPHGCNDDDDA